MLKKTLPTLLVFSLTVLFAGGAILPKQKSISKRALKKIYQKYSITSENEGSFNNKIDRIFIHTVVDEPLNSVFAYSFEHSLISAFESNGVIASIVRDKISESAASSNGKLSGVEKATTVAMIINIKTIYRTHPDGYQAIVGDEFEVSISDLITDQRVWHSAGKVDYIRDYYFNRPNYSAHSSIRKEFAFNTTRAIVSAFISEVNDRRPAVIYHVIEDREKHGQRTD